jgi:hypothetical protein
MFHNEIRHWIKTAHGSYQIRPAVIQQTHHEQKAICWKINYEGIDNPNNEIALIKLSSREWQLEKILQNKITYHIIHQDTIYKFLEKPSFCHSLDRIPPLSYWKFLTEINGKAINSMELITRLNQSDAGGS